MRFSLRTLLLLFAVIAGTLVGIQWFKDWLDPFAGRSFDRDVWHQFHNNDAPDNPRASMVKSLQRGYLNQGLNRQQIVELLGEPDMKKSPEIYEYNLGMWSGFRMDYDGLQIHVNTQGQLSHVQCVQH